MRDHEPDTPVIACAHVVKDPSRTTRLYMDEGGDLMAFCGCNTHRVSAFDGARVIPLRRILDALPVLGAAPCLVPGTAWARTSGPWCIEVDRILPNTSNTSMF